MKIVDVSKAYGYKSKTVALFDEEFDKNLSFGLRDFEGKPTGEMRFLHVPSKDKHMFSKNGDRYIIPLSKSVPTIDSLKKQLENYKPIGLSPSNVVSSNFDGNKFTNKPWLNVPETVSKAYNMQEVDYVFTERDIDLLYSIVESDIKQNGFTDQTLPKAKQAIREIKKLVMQD